VNVRTDGFSAPERDELAWLGTRAIPPKPYYDPDWHADEVEAIFKRSWIPGPAAHVQGPDEPGYAITRPDMKRQLSHGRPSACRLTLPRDLFTGG